MSTKALCAATYVAILGSVPSSATCQHLGHGPRAIVLNGFSDRNYIALNGAMGVYVCIRGKISVDTAGIYFALQPIESRGVIDIGFSRIISGLSVKQARRGNMANGGRYRICGILRDATPFRHCDHDHCKWYELENAELR